MLLDQGLPASVSECKDHPLYVLKRHLLKYQAVYPPDAMPIGHLRNEPVYSRDDQVTLHSRQTWLKYARKVKAYENPDNIVKGRIKMVFIRNFLSFFVYNYKSIILIVCVKSDYKNGIRENPDLDVYGKYRFYIVKS